MENEKIKAEFQIGKNYIKEFSIDVLDKNMPKNKAYSFELEVGISDIKIKEEYEYANIFLKYVINLKENEKEYVKIFLKAVGEFRSPKEVEKSKFLNYCKYKGAPMISQNVRAYLKAVTALSDLEPINLPMINFEEVFKNKK